MEFNGIDYNLIKDKFWFFIKSFKEKEHAESLTKGNLYINPLKKFREIEIKNGYPGQGDKYEGGLFIKQASMQVQDPNNKEYMGDLILNDVFLHSEILSKTPVYCMYVVNFDVIKPVNSTEEYLEFAIDMNGPEGMQFIKDFGPYSVLLQGKGFLDAVEKAFKIQNIDLLHGKVRYWDYSILQKERIIVDLDHPINCFNKSDKFKSQNEYRMVLKGIQNDEGQIYNIGSLDGIAFMVETEKLFNGDLTLRFPIYEKV